MVLEELGAHSNQRQGGSLLTWDEHLQAWCASIMPQSVNGKEKRLLRHHGLQKVPLKGGAGKPES